MSNTSWACFECRETVRRQADECAVVPCPNCGERCRYIGRKLRMPPKRQAKAWRELLAELQQLTIARAEARHLARLQSIRELQSEIDRLEAKGPNAGRAKQVRLLRRQLSKM